MKARQQKGEQAALKSIDEGMIVHVESHRMNVCSQPRVHVSVSFLPFFLSLEGSHVLVSTGKYIERL